ncbi:MAG: ABC transporter ATP-binding protein [Halanaeroarchaeum sp.]
MAAITVSDLSKDYGEVLANDDVSFTVEEGEVFGYLGPNGAGKTTTIRTLMGFQSPTSGSAELLGHDVRDEGELIAAKRRVGYLPGNPAFDEHVTGREILDLHAAVKGDERRAELLELFDPPLDRKVREYSSGNRQMLGLVQAFMHDPDLVVMDEPTSGLDPLKQQEFNAFVRREQREGTTVFMSSHILSEVRRVCDRVGIIRDGRLVTVERVEDLLDRSGKFVHLRTTDRVDAADLRVDGVHDLDVRTMEADGSAPGGESATDVDAATTITEVTFTYTGDVNALLERIAAYDLLDLEVEEAPLEEVFMRFYGGESDA